MCLCSKKIEVHVSMLQNYKKMGDLLQNLQNMCFTVLLCMILKQRGPCTFGQRQKYTTSLKILFTLWPRKKLLMLFLLTPKIIEIAKLPKIIEIVKIAKVDKID